MASKEYYDIAYGLRDLAKELNRPDVINTIDSEIKKMKFNELGKNINYSHISKINKNKEENKDKYKSSKKKTILATENLEDDNYAYTKSTPVLKQLRKDLYGESLGEDLEETSPYTSIKSNGIYSLNTGWVKHPVQQDIPNIDMDEFEKEFKVWEDKYFDLLNKLNK